MNPISVQPRRFPLHRNLKVVCLGLSMIFLAGCASRMQAVALSERQTVARNMFAERCKGSGEKIHRVVENVEGISILKLRPPNLNYSDQFVLNDPYGMDFSGDGYLQSFLRGQYLQNHGGITPENSSRVPKGFLYIETINPMDRKRYRHTGSIKATGRKDASAPTIQRELSRNPDFDMNIYEYVMDSEPAAGSSPRYGVTYDDISTREDREYWIAGSSLKVIDLQTNEVIGERIGYMVDLAQGNQAGGRSPWLLAANNACPDFTAGNSKQAFSSTPYQAVRFVEKVLKPTKNN